MGSPTKAITPADRIGALEECGVKFKDHLIDVSGIALTAELRLAVATCARDAIHCKACMDSLPKDVCLRPGTRVFERIYNVEHTVPQLEGIANPEVEKVIVSIVHAVINHQGRLDKQWYDDCLEAVRLAGVVQGTGLEEKKNRYLEYSVFAEILCVATISHCVNLAFLVMGQPVPRLPTMKEIMEGRAHRDGPLLLDWSALLSNPPKRDPSSAFAHHFPFADINKGHAEFQRISKQAQKAMETCLDPMHPCLFSGFAPEDTRMISMINDVYYIPDKDMMALFRLTLDPSVRCADDFTRFDIEFTAHHLAKAQQCGY